MIILVVTGLLGEVLDPRIIRFQVGEISVSWITFQEDSNHRLLRKAQKKRQAKADKEAMWIMILFCYLFPKTSIA